MSCTPTTEALIISLDFEGVRSIERTAQEDTLLVLFNTAISNMVCAGLFHVPLFSLAFQILFRNNFALSRDIAGLFTVRDNANIDAD